jgi:hypothetical protein
LALPLLLLALYDISQALSVAAKVQGSASATEELDTFSEELEAVAEEPGFASETLDELAAELDSGIEEPILEEDSKSPGFTIGFEVESSPQAMKHIAVERVRPKPHFL